MGGCVCEERERENERERESVCMRVCAHTPQPHTCWKNSSRTSPALFVCVRCVCVRKCVVCKREREEEDTQTTYSRTGHRFAELGRSLPIHTAPALHSACCLAIIHPIRPSIQLSTHLPLAPSLPIYLSTLPLLYTPPAIWQQSALSAPLSKYLPICLSLHVAIYSPSLREVEGLPLRVSERKRRFHV